MCQRLHSVDNSAKTCHIAQVEGMVVGCLGMISSRVFVGTETWI